MPTNTITLTTREFVIIAALASLIKDKGNELTNPLTGTTLQLLVENYVQFLYSKTEQWDKVAKLLENCGDFLAHIEGNLVVIPFKPLDPNQEEFWQEIFKQHWENLI